MDTDETGLGQPEARRALGQMLVGNVLRTAATRHATREALYCVGTGRRLTYAQLNERANRLANGLSGLGLRQGDVVAFLCSNRAEIVEIYFALAKSGIAGLPLNYRLAPREIADLLITMDAKALICERRFSATQDKLAACGAANLRTIWIDDDAPHAAGHYEALLQDSAADEPDAALDEADVFYYNLTSGTTGLPKCYAITQYNLSALDSTVVSFDLTRQDVFLNVFPAFGRVGFGWSLVAVLLGSRNVLMDFDAKRVPEVIRAERITFTNLVPTMASLILAEPGFDPRSTSSLRAICFVGAMLPRALREAAAERLCPGIYEAYGLQETGYLSVSTPEDRVRKPDSVGQVVLFSEVRIVDASGADVPTGTTGEILGRSPNGITGYHNNPQRNAEVFRNGWFHTGDLGRLDADGHLYISGRVKDMIISGGQNVHASEIEAALVELTGVADCAVIGLPDPLWGEVVAAVVVPREPAPSVEALQDFCRERLAGFKVPRRVFFQSEALPRTPTGKVQKFLLVERYGA